MDSTKALTTGLTIVLASLLLVSATPRDLVPAYVGGIGLAMGFALFALGSLIYRWERHVTLSERRDTIIRAFDEATASADKAPAALVG